MMFRELVSDYTERVDVIGTRKFIELVEELERAEDMQFETFEVGKDKLRIVTIFPDPAKIDRDIALPELSPILKEVYPGSRTGLSEFKIDQKFPVSEKHLQQETFYRKHRLDSLQSQKDTAEKLFKVSPSAHMVTKFIFDLFY